MFNIFRFVVLSMFRCYLEGPDCAGLAFEILGSLRGF